MAKNDEQLLDENLKAEMAKYDEAGFFRRLFKMFAGFSKPRSSREYKEALIELQRLAAPLLAILLPVLFIGVLFVVTAIQAKEKQEIKVEIAKAEQEEKLEEIQEPPDVEQPPDTDVDVQMESPTIGPTTESEPTPQTNEPQSPKVNNVDAMQNIQSPVMMKNVFGSSRSTGVRGAYTRGGASYGDPKTEGAVMKALRWLKLKQAPDGSWPGIKPASTGLAILTFLAHGETPASKEFGGTVQRALEFLMRSVQDHGGKVTVAGSDGNEYAFLIAMYALCEAYGMTKNPNVQEVAEKGLVRIIRGQSPTGGWDYKINKASVRDDLSFAGWALQALKAGKMAGMHPPGMDECIKKAIRCLQTRNFYKGHFTYCANSRGHPGLTATGCLAMQLLGHSDKKEVKAALDYMKEWKPAFVAADTGVGKDCPSPQYYCYYAAQCKYQAGMCKGATPINQKIWKDWNTAMKALYPKIIKDVKDKNGNLVKVKDPAGKEQNIGYWENKDQFSTRPVMDTCLTALQLMVYYRYLPTTSLKATEVETDLEELSKDKGGEVGVTIDI